MLLCHATLKEMEMMQNACSFFCLLVDIQLILMDRYGTK